MFTTIAFSESQDAAAAFSKLNAVADQHVKTETTRIIVPEFASILVGAAAFLGTTGQFLRLISPSLRRLNLHHISPVGKLLVPAAVNTPWLNPRHPIPLVPAEALEVEELADPAAAEVHTVIALLSDGAIAPYEGEIRRIRATITLAQLASAWAFSELTLIDELPVGNYDIVGANLVAAGAVAFRLVGKGDKHRPGGLALQDDDDLIDPLQMKGGMGVWGSFHTTTLPGVEVISSAAAGSATYQMLLDIVPR